MIKKTFVGILLVGLVGLLIFGAVNRTLARSSTESYAGGGNGRNSSETTVNLQRLPGDSEAQAEGGNGRGGYGTGDTSSQYAGRQGEGANGRGGGGYGNGRQQSELGNLPSADPAGLSAEETAALAYMREEEKLAHDVYLALYARWGSATFQNIANSEQAHTEAVRALLERYGLADPASSQVGVFANPELQALYTTLIAQGSGSLAEALKVGAAIEEIDILDLQERLAQTDNADIQQVFTNLLHASGNHLRAFASALQTQTGETYQPQHMSQPAYLAILEEGSQTGSGGYGQSGGQGNAGGNGQGYRGGRP